ncbi:MAG: hypothetical protein RJA44_800 [Pseudomonadota bacterium]
MYESHFGFSSPPFQLNPDPAFFYNSRGHGHALAYLQYGVAQGEGFIVVTGEIGAGKTTLVRTLLDQLDREQVLPAQVVSTQLGAEELLESICTAFGIGVQHGGGKAQMIGMLEAFLTGLAAQGRRALLIIDEAQNLSLEAIEELRMLSNFQLGNHALLQSFLVGQPELRAKLDGPSMEQLRQRIMASCHLGPLGLEETQSYIEHRLQHVGWRGRPGLDDPAFDQIYAWTAGVPRRINRLCNRLLLTAYLEGSDISAELVQTTARQLRDEIGETSFEPVPIPVRAPKPPPVPVAEPEVVSTPVVVEVAAAPVAEVPVPAQVEPESEPAVATPLKPMRIKSYRRRPRPAPGAPVPVMMPLPAPAAAPGPAAPAFVARAIEANPFAPPAPPQPDGLFSSLRQWLQRSFGF